MILTRPIQISQKSYNQGQHSNANVHTWLHAAELHVRQRKSMEKWEIRPPLSQKPLNRSSPKFAWVITSWTRPMQNFITLRLPPFPPKYAKMRIEWLASFFSELELTHAHVRYRPICRCSSVCLSSVCLSVTFVRPTQAIGIFGNVSMPFNTLVIWRHPGKILLRSSQGNPSVGRVKHNRGIAKYSDFGYFRGYISETVQDRR